MGAKRPESLVLYIKIMMSSSKKFFQLILNALETGNNTFSVLEKGK